MKKSILTVTILIASLLGYRAQTAMDFKGLDCNGNMRHCFADLDSGKAVVLFFYMPNCGSCPPPASKVQAMCNNLMKNYPGKVKGYAYPYQDVTTCAYSASWVTSNNLGFYFPMDSGATQVAYYGGFGMPTVVLLGGKNHRTMFSTQSFSTSDTTVMRDSIINMLGVTSIREMESAFASFHLYPNPANEKLQLQLEVLRSCAMKAEILNVLGEVVLKVYEGIVPAGIFRKEASTAPLPNGSYLLRISTGQRSHTYNFKVSH